MNLTTKNIRAATLGQPDAYELGLVASRYCGDTNRQAVDMVLGELGMSKLAHAALLRGVGLDAVGDSGPYANRAQRAAWAAGRLLDCLRCIDHAYALVDERSAVASREAVLLRSAEAYRIEAKAAWRQVKIDVPFREPRKIERVDWLLS